MALLSLVHRFQIDTGSSLYWRQRPHCHILPPWHHVQSKTLHLDIENLLQLWIAYSLYLKMSERRYPVRRLFPVHRSISCNSFPVLGEWELALIDKLTQKHQLLFLSDLFQLFPKLFPLRFFRLFCNRIPLDFKCIKEQLHIQCFKFFIDWLNDIHKE